MTRGALAPVAVFAYNRPVHLKRTLDALAVSHLANRTEVHVFSDGARNSGTVEAVRDVREVLSGEAVMGRFASFSVHASESNLGLANSIIHGVGKLLSGSDKVIVVEDDLLVSRDFLEFMNDCLDFYRDDESVGAVTGFCPLSSFPPDYHDDVLLVGRNSSQGWGTWSHVWRGVDWSAGGMHRLARSWKLRRAFNAEGNDRYDRLRRQLAGRIDSWSVRFGLSLFLRGMGTIYPAVNRVSNIGYDGSGVHSGTGVPKNSNVGEATYTLVRVIVDPRIQSAFHETYSGPQPGRMLRDVLAMFPRLAGWLGR